MVEKKQPTDINGNLNRMHLTAPIKDRGNNYTQEKTLPFIAANRYPPNFLNLPSQQQKLRIGVS